MIAVADLVHPQGLLVGRRPQRGDGADELEQDERHRERVGRCGQHRQHLVAELREVAVQRAVGEPVPALLREEPDEEDPGEAGHAVGGEDVEGLVDAAAGAQQDDEVAR